MRVLIIGGSGFISRGIVARLLERGHDVTVVNRGMSPSPFAGDGRVKHIVADRNDGSRMTELLKGRTFDAVYDMIAYQRSDSEQAVRTFTGATGRFIHCSTVSVYMVSEEVTCPVTEDQSTRAAMPFLDRNPYGMEYGLRKRDCEEVLWGAHDLRNFPVTIIRPTYVSGPGDPMRRDYFWIQRILDGKPLLIPGSGEIPFQQVYVEDLVGAFTDLLGIPVSVGRAYNIVGEEIRSLIDYLKVLARLLGREIQTVPVDRDIFESLPFSTVPGEHVFPFDARWTSVFSLDRAKRDLGYASTPFDIWMTRTIDWYIHTHKGPSAGYQFRDDEVEFARKYQSLRSEWNDQFRR